MARDYARVYVQIWDDPDWVRLNSVQQLAYLTLISSGDLSYAGVAPYLPARYALLARDWTERKMAGALAELEGKGFLIIDRSTAEILVRSYVRHDGLTKQPNVMKALVAAFSRIHSDVLRQAVGVELARLLREQPNAAGWKGFREASPELFAWVSGKGSAKGSGKGTGKGSATLLPLPLTPTPSSSSPSVTKAAASETADAKAALADPGKLLKAADG